MNTAKKHYFIFSDADPSLFSQPGVTVTYQKKLGWPYDTLKRFHMFLRVEQQLRDYDYIFFFNANVLFQAPIGDEILPTHHEGLVVVQHPGFFSKTPREFTYDRNPKSLAYIPKGKGHVYVMGGVNGGRSKEYLDLIHDLAWAIDKDLEQNIIALWHDESHLNRYILSRRHKLLPPSYGFPQNSAIPYDNIITIVDKNNFGGHDFLRDAKGTLPSSRPTPFLLRVLRKLQRALHGASL